MNNLTIYKVLFVLLICNNLVTAQIVFEPGYYISSDNIKVEGYVLNKEWKRNPIEITFKKKIDGTEITKKLTELNEFGVNGISKYIGVEVEIDRSSSTFRYMSENKFPEFKKERLFLKLEVKGIHNLYSYEDINIKRFFVGINNDKIIQLVYKKYRVEPGTLQGENTSYKQQLLNLLDCDVIEDSDFVNLEYKTRNLRNIFNQFNNCEKDDAVIEELKERDFISIIPKIGFRTASAMLSDEAPRTQTVKYNRVNNLEFGLDSELILPFNKNKWRVVLGAYYKSYESTTEFGFPANSLSLTFNSLEFPIGVRHYLFLNQNTAIHLNLKYTVDIALNNSILDFPNPPDIELSPRNFLSTGVGLCVGKFDLELKYNVPREIFDREISWSSRYNSLSLLVGYKIVFRKMGTR